MDALKETKDLYSENCKTLMKDMREDKKKKKMERYTMLLEWKNRYCQHYYIMPPQKI